MKKMTGEADEQWQQQQQQHTHALKKTVEKNDNKSIFEKTNPSKCER